MQIFTKTDKGRVRKENQDAFFASMLSENTAFAVVCDGMGGANAGNVASITAVNSIKRYIETAYNDSLSNDAKVQLLQNAVISANIELFSMSQNNEELRGMGTTVVTVIADRENAFICHVGDSRAYLINNDIVQITKDHSVVQSLIESGDITPEEAKKHPKKNVITRALGVGENVIPDVTSIAFLQDSHLLLCTDGLTNFTDLEYIKDIIQSKDNGDKAELLCEEANRNGGGDNITAVIISKVQKGV